MEETSSKDESAIDLALLQWQKGDWSNLSKTKLSDENFAEHQVFLNTLVGAANFQNGDLSSAREILLKNKKISPEIINIMMASMHNSLGVAAYLCNDGSRSYKLLKESSNYLLKCIGKNENNDDFGELLVHNQIRRLQRRIYKKNSKEQGKIFMNYKSYEDLLMDIKNNIGSLHKYKFDLIVGMPRSGMTVAYILAGLMNIDVTDLEGLIENRKISRGRTRISKGGLIFPSDAEKILLVDDSIFSGVSLFQKTSKIPDDLRKKITTLAVYSSEPFREDVDIFFEHLELPRRFEWNIFHRKELASSCFDIDGVLCEDPMPGQDDDGEKYINFILNAKPYILPTYKIHSLVTNRLEKYRPYTEEWLKKHNVKYNNLIMLDLPDKETRIRTKAHIPHKANYFKSNEKLDLFIESSEWQAKEIAKASGKPVYCTDVNKMFNP